ncbi:MAG: SEC-C domain-containing protein [Bacteroidetes bacterium]|nr:SEC-C domain-containing protein [Bacteroidota bacterium]
MKKIGRNALCHCGSGKKYKNCHWKKSTGGTVSTTFWVYLIVVVIVITVAVIIFNVSSNNPTTQRRTFTPQSPGPAPPGKVWSPEHGHWHDATPTQQQSGPPFLQSPGPVPDGKVWSPEHGHWHDVSSN